jgi:hypothetical protein
LAIPLQKTFVINLLLRALLAVGSQLNRDTADDRSPVGGGLRFEDAGRFDHLQPGKRQALMIEAIGKLGAIFIPAKDPCSRRRGYHTILLCDFAEF